LKNNVLWYERPAKSWVEALPIGNGRLGGMIYGDTQVERIALNEDTLWSGYPRNQSLKNKRQEYLEAVELAKSGQYQEAQTVIEKELTSDWTESYLPMGDLLLDFKQKGERKNYRRELDLSEAVVHIEYDLDQVHYTRELFASAADDIMVIKLTADKKNSISFKATIKSQLRSKVIVEENWLILNGQAPSHVEPSYVNSENPILYSDIDEEKGMQFAVMTKILPIGGKIVYGEKEIVVEQAHEVIILLQAATSFAGYDVLPYLEGKDYIGLCKEGIQSAAGRTYEQLRADHVADYKNYYDRVDLSVGENDRSGLPTDERLYRFKEDPMDPSLYTLLFQFGRYLMIASSRVGTQAINLQGIWNCEVRPPWSSNYTININTEMNYWPVFSSGLGELQEPLVRLIKELYITGQVTAKEMYGVEGFVSHHNTDIWRLSSPVGNHVHGSARYAFWNGSAGWLCRHLYDQYEYTLDIDFLREVAYPIMKAAANFILNTLIKDKDGYLIHCPSTSPENGFAYHGESCVIAATTTMSMTIARELFHNCIKSCEQLKCDEEFAKSLEEAIERLYPFQIGREGQLLEWYKDYEEEELNHRHISHLYGLYPGNEITQEDTPELAKAGEISLNRRGDDGTGWSLGWKINQWARLKNGNRALKLLNRQLQVVEDTGYNYSSGGGTYINMFDAHPPFQIDGNFAATAGIAEMLLQSRENQIFILPALPDRWKEGYVKGLCAKNGVTVSMEWDDEKVKVELVSTVNQTLNLNVKGKNVGEVQIMTGIPSVISFEVQ